MTVVRIGLMQVALILQKKFYAQLESKLELSWFYPSFLLLELPSVSDDSDDELLLNSKSFFPQ